MDRQAVALIDILSGTCDVCHRHDSPEFPGSVSDEDFPHQKLFAFTQQKHTCILATDEHIPHIDLNLALAVSHL